MSVRTFTGINNTNYDQPGYYYTFPTNLLIDVGVVADQPLLGNNYFEVNFVEGGIWFYIDSILLQNPQIGPTQLGGVNSLRIHVDETYTGTFTMQVSERFFPVQYRGVG